MRLDLGAGDDSTAFGINNAGDVVGNLGTRGGYIYTDDFGLVKLDEAVDGDFDDLALWLSSYTAPEAINDDGWICVWSQESGAFLLIPQKTLP